MRNRYGGGKHWKYAFGTLIAVLIIGGALVGLGYINFNTAGASNQQTGTQLNTNTNLNGGAVTQSACTQLASGYPKLQGSLSYLNQSNGNASVQGVAVPFNISVYPYTSGAFIAQGVSAANGQFWTNSTLPCGATVQGFVGDNSHEYIQYTQPFQIGSGLTTLSVSNLAKMAQLSSVKFSNATTFGNTTVSLGQLASAGQTYYITETVNLGNGAYGGTGIEAAYAYNASEVQSISLVPISGFPAGFQIQKWTDPSGSALPSLSYVPTGYTTTAFQLPAQSAWGSVLSFKVAIQLKSAFTSNTQVNAFINDIVNYPTGGMTLTPSTVSASGSDLGEAYTHVGTLAANQLAPTGAINIMSS